MKKGIISIVGITIIIVIIIKYSFNLSSYKKIISPTSLTRATLSVTQKRIIGFLPFWQMSALDTIHLTPADEIIYFSLKSTQDGDIAEKDDDGNAEGGFTTFSGPLFERLTQQSQTNNTKITIAITLQDNRAIETFLADPVAQDRLIENVWAIVKEHNLSGINIDFEYSGIPGKETINNYTQFIAHAATRLKDQFPDLSISVDTTADAVKKSRLYDVSAIAKIVDYVVLMGYDFYRPSSSVAGPVAPLKGKETYEYDITTAVTDFLQVVPKEKLLLGVAYYGWDFPTKNEDKGSFVEKRPDETVALSTYKRNRKLIEEKKVNLHFDEESQTPWMTYKDPDTEGWRQVWYENEVSLAKKYDLIKSENLAGVAIWALGYDGPYGELNKLLLEKFRK